MSEEKRSDKKSPAPISAEEQAVIDRIKQFGQRMRSSAWRKTLTRGAANYGRKPHSVK